MKTSVLLFLLLFPTALLVGSVWIEPAEVCDALFAPERAGETARFIVWEARLPQALTAVLSGMALAVSGLVMQSLFANPLADPSLLGVSSGASFGAAVALLCGGAGAAAVGLASWGGVLLTVVAAFAGALGVIALLLACSALLRGNLALLIAGVMIGFALSAVISLMSFLATEDGLHSYLLWGMGDFSGVGMRLLPLYAALALLPTLAVLSRPHLLDALLLGDDYAANLGVRVRRERTLLLLLTGLLTASVTALCGPISFVGLAVPHIARLFSRTAVHRRLLPATCVWGADVALLSLVLTHLPGTRGLLPLSAVTPLLGVPVVFYILLKRR